MIQPKPVHYPDSDGRYMGESESHGDTMVELMQTIRAWLDDLDGYHVHGNQFFYYEEGNPGACFAPDVYVIRGIPQLPRRRSWKLWEEPHAVPALVIELTSVSSAQTDVTTKRALYERLGVEEYVVFDVLDEVGPQPLRMWRRQPSGRFDEQTTFRCELLGVTFGVQDHRLRLVTPDGQRVPSMEERAASERARAEQLDQELSALRAELARLRGDDAPQRRPREGDRRAAKQGPGPTGAGPERARRRPRRRRR